MSSPALSAIPQVEAAGAGELQRRDPRQEADLARQEARRAQLRQREDVVERDEPLLPPDLEGVEGGGRLAGDAAGSARRPPSCAGPGATGRRRRARPWESRPGHRPRLPRAAHTREWKSPSRTPGWPWSTRLFRSSQSLSTSLGRSAAQGQARVVKDDGLIGGRPPGRGAAVRAPSSASARQRERASGGITAAIPGRARRPTTSRAPTR